MADANGGHKSRARTSELQASEVGGCSSVGGCVPRSKGLLRARGHFDCVG